MEAVGDRPIKHRSMAVLEGKAVTGGIMSLDH